MPTDDRTALFQRYHKLVYKIAKNISEKYNRPYHEMVAEGLGALTWEIWGRDGHFDEKKAGRSHWYYQSIYWHLVCYCDKLRKTTTFDIDHCEHPAFKRSWIEGLLRELGDEGKELVRIICEAPGELAAELAPRAPVRSRAAVRRYLSSENWTDHKIERVWHEVECAIGV